MKFLDKFKLVFSFHCKDASMTSVTCLLEISGKYTIFVDVTNTLVFSKKTNLHMAIHSPPCTPRVLNFPVTSGLASFSICFLIVSRYSDSMVNTIKIISIAAVWV